MPLLYNTNSTTGTITTRISTILVLRARQHTVILIQQSQGSVILGFNHYLCRPSLFFFNMIQQLGESYNFTTFYVLLPGQCTCPSCRAWHRKTIYAVNIVGWCTCITLAVAHLPCIFLTQSSFQCDDGLINIKAAFIFQQAIRKPPY